MTYHEVGEYRAIQGEMREAILAGIRAVAKERNLAEPSIAEIENMGVRLDDLVNSSVMACDAWPEEIRAECEEQTPRQDKGGGFASIAFNRGSDILRAIIPQQPSLAMGLAGSLDS